jgi:hypothetical protein
LAYAAAGQTGQDLLKSKRRIRRRSAPRITANEAMFSPLSKALCLYNWNQEGMVIFCPAIVLRQIKIDFLLSLRQNGYFPKNLFLPRRSPKSISI